jgi:hypothetical protein
MNLCKIIQICNKWLRKLVAEYGFICHFTDVLDIFCIYLSIGKVFHFFYRVSRFNLARYINGKK